MGYINKDLILSGLNLRLIRLKSEHESEEKINELENIIGAISETETEDVVERSEYKRVLKENEGMKEVLREHPQIKLNDLERNIDNAINEMLVFQNDLIRSQKTDIATGVASCIEILKKNIGE